MNNTYPKVAYRGFTVRGATGGFIVTVTTLGPQQHAETVHLPPRNNLRDHSPNGFAWGYMGSGPAQLALALLAHALGNDSRALRHHQHVKETLVARLPTDKGWRLTRAQVVAALPPCPYCGGPLGAHPSVSRTDNRTDICPRCGTGEAMADAFRHPYSITHLVAPWLPGHLEWHCDTCHHTEPMTNYEYEEGDSEPCVHCSTGVAMVRVRPVPAVSA